MPISKKNRNSRSNQDPKDLLLKAARDLISIGYEDYFLSKEDEKRIYSSISNLCSGLVLLFKHFILLKSPDKISDLLLYKNHEITFVDGDITLKKRGDLTIGFQDLKERFQCLDIDSKDILKDFDTLRKLRNNIIHSYTKNSYSTLQEAVYDNFRIIIKCEEKFSLKMNEVFEKKIWEKIIKESRTHQQLQQNCHDSWNVIKKDFKFLKSRIFPGEEIEIFEPPIIGFLYSSTCPHCSSSLVKYINHDFSKNLLDINLSCYGCSSNFSFIDILNGVLRFHYIEEIIKACIKDGKVPIDICNTCEKEVFLSYNNICMYCGSHEAKENQSNFHYDLCSWACSD